MTESLSADSADTVQAVPDGVRLSDLTAGLPLSRDSVFKLIKALGLTTTKGPGPDGRGRSAWLSSAEAVRLETAALAVHRGEVRIADLAQGLQRQPTQQTMLTAPEAASAESADIGMGAKLQARLRATEMAINTGLPLTTAEVSWLLGGAKLKPKNSPETRGRIQAVYRISKWTLQSADSADAANQGDSDQNI